MTPRTRLPLSCRSPRCIACAGLCALALTVGVEPAHAQVPAEFTGDWVPASAMCSSPARIRVEAAKITLVNGTDS